MALGTGDEHTVTGAYPKPAGGRPDFPGLEVEVLDYWERDDTFRASIAQRDGAEEYVFYDGPPFANGLPHYGHLLTGYVKDIVPRYQTMRGFKVERRFGWDTHGLPAELEVQRQLGITEKAQIEEMGIEEFNEACRASVLKYTEEWRAYVTRQARWVDFDNDYKTLDLGYMESVLWAFKQLWDKGLAYEGNRVLPYCWNDETPLSSHELRMDDDVYQSRQDPALTVGFSVADGELAGAYLLVWTTTPWTLPSNQAVAVNPDVTYVQVRAPTAAVRARRGAAGRLRARTGRGAGGPRHLPRPRPARHAVPAAVPVLHGLAPTPFGCCPVTSSPPRTAPASCTWRPPTARTTRRPPTRPASWRSRRSTPRAGSTRPCPTTRASTSSTPTRRSSAT